MPRPLLGQFSEIAARGRRRAGQALKGLGRSLCLGRCGPEDAGNGRGDHVRIDGGEEPGSPIGMRLVERPAPRSSGDEPGREGPGGAAGDRGGGGPGDLIAAGLREDYEQYDFAIPLVPPVADGNVERLPLDIYALPPFNAMSRMQLAALLLGLFTSHDPRSGTLFGDYRVDGVAMTVGSYNELLSRLTRRVIQAMNHPLPKSGRISPHLHRPQVRLNAAALAMALDGYIRDRLFDEPFEPSEDEGWRLLLLQPVLDHIVRIFGVALVRVGEHGGSGFVQVRHRRLSEVTKLMVRESASLAVGKCIYTRLPCAGRGEALERAFIEWAQADAGVEAFCRIVEDHHDFARLRYVQADGRPASCFPDFLVRTAEAVYLVETGLPRRIGRPDVQRKLQAASAWCERINALAPELRGGRPWHYTLVGESLFYDWREQDGRLGGLLAFSRGRAVPAAQSRQGQAPGD